MKITTGGSSLTLPALASVFRHCPKGGTILEIGSGRSSQVYANAQYKVIAVEHDKAWMKFPNVEYIHAPLKNGWYSREHFLKVVGREVDMIIIDGPPDKKGTGCRKAILEFLELLPRVPILVDDVQREAEAELVEEIEALLGYVRVSSDGGLHKSVVLSPDDETCDDEASGSGGGHEAHPNGDSPNGDSPKEAQAEAPKEEESKDGV